MTGQTVCNVIQAFPVLLILAQKAEKCLKTPFVYKPPTSTHPPEYYEAYDTLLHSLIHDKCQKPCYSYPSYSTYPTYPSYPSYPNHHSYEYGSYPDGYVGYSHNRYRAMTGLNLSTDYSYKSNYAPTQVYNTKHKHKVVVVKTKRRKSARLQGFFPQRDNRRVSPASPFGLIQNVIPDPNRIRNTLSGILHFQPGNVVNNNERPYSYNNGQNNFDSRPNNYDNRPYNYDNGPNNYNNGPYNYDYRPNKYDDRPNNYEYQTNRPNNVRFPVNVPNDDVNFDPQTTRNEVNQNSGTISGTVSQGPGIVSGTVGQDQGFNSEKNQDSGIVSGTVSQDQGFKSESVGQVTEEPSYGKDSGLISGTENTLASGNKFGEEEGGLLSGTVGTPKEGDFAFGNRNGIVSGSVADRVFDEPCKTVDGGAGNCISLSGCEPYLQLIKTARTNAKSRMTLQRSQCGFEGSLPKVCCPLPGIPSLPPTEATTTTTTTTTAATAVAKTADDSDYVAAFPEPPVCGVSAGSFGKVVGGIDANLGDFPWIALLGYTNKRDQSTRWRCGGSLITEKHVLTAAHCIHNHEDELYVVRLGELDLTKDDDGASPIDVLIKTKVKHEQYNPSSFENDIAVLLLQSTVQFTKLINPICLPFTGSLRQQKFERLNPMIAGWGDVQFRGPSATHLQVVQLPVQTNPLCVKAYEKYPKQVIDDRVLCAGYKEGGKDACQGDSGGPLMLPNWNNVTFKVYFYQIGVVSYGKNCAEAGFPGVYSRLTHFIPWLEKVVLGRS